MAQFSHSDFGGMSQWSSGMTMVGDMFNTSLKSKLDALCTELAANVAQAPSEWSSRRDRDEVSYRAPRQGVRLLVAEPSGIAECGRGAE